MRIPHVLATMCVATALATTCAPAQAPLNPVPSGPRQMAIADGKFMLDGQPIQLLCGEMHYPRIPRELWRDRLRKARAMGLNCVSAYVFWSFHERAPGEFDFSGNADVAEFVRIAQQEGLLVFLRPGPYVCAEYDFGGFPYWLQNIPNMRWRSNDPRFMECMERYLGALAEQLAPLQVTRGGPIALVQVENEYGSYDSDKVYLGKIRDLVRKVGFDVPLTTCDGAGQMPNGMVDGCLPTINGALGQQIIETIDKHHPGGPYMVAEFYPAWFDNWGQAHSTKDKDSAARQFEWMLEHGVSVSLYMFHGGTNFGFTNGANSPPYRAQPTSYDYDAPLSEYGFMTPKFMLFREAVQRHLTPGQFLPPLPPQPKVVTVAAFPLSESCPLAAALPAPVKSERPLTFEALHQDFGYVLYRTVINQPVTGTLVCDDIRHYGWVYLNGKLAGKMDHSQGCNSLQLAVEKGPAQLDILVENLGRVNYGAGLLDNHCGITKSVTLNGRELTGWENFPLPLYQAKVASLPFGKPAVDGPAFFRGSFELSEIGEMFLDTSKWGKGAVWVNGHCLGKFWRIGPQQTMYLPSCWAKVGKNEVVVMELDDRGARSLEGLSAPVLNRLQMDAPTGRERPGRRPILDPGDLALDGCFASTGVPQDARFGKPVSGRYLCLEVLGAHGGDPMASIAELAVLGADGQALPRKNWTIWYVSSEETREENALAENLLDGNPDTCWQSEQASKTGRPPHTVVIDMGEIQEGLRGIRYTGRADHPNGRVNQCRVYVRPQFFLSKDG